MKPVFSAAGAQEGKRWMTEGESWRESSWQTKRTQRVSLALGSGPSANSGRKSLKGKPTHRPSVTIELSLHSQWLSAYSKKKNTYLWSHPVSGESPMGWESIGLSQPQACRVLMCMNLPNGSALSLESLLQIPECSAGIGASIRTGDHWRILLWLTWFIVVILFYYQPVEKGYCWDLNHKASNKIIKKSQMIFFFIDIFWQVFFFIWDLNLQVCNIKH